jgi:hypothetical protein
MVGREVEAVFPKREVVVGAPVLELAWPLVRDRGHS